MKAPARIKIESAFNTVPVRLTIYQAAAVVAREWDGYGTLDDRFTTACLIGCYVRNRIGMRCLFIENAEFPFNAAGATGSIVTKAKSGGYDIKLHNVRISIKHLDKQRLDAIRHLLGAA